MKICKKIGLLVVCLIGFATNLQAEEIKVKVNNGETVTITNCSNRDNPRCWSDEKVIGMAKVYKPMEWDKPDFEDGDFEIIRKDEDQTPTLGKVQNKLNELGSEVFGLIGL